MTSDTPAARWGSGLWAGHWAAYAASLWAFVFAAMSFYWAAGGLVGVDTLGSVITRLARDPGFVAVVWLTGALKVVGGVFALALVQRWGRMLPRWLLLVGAWAAGVGMAIYGAVPLVVNGLMLARLLRVADAVEWTAIWWHFLLWDPWWLLGGVLFILAASQYQRRTGVR